MMCGKTEKCKNLHKIIDEFESKCIEWNKNKKNPQIVFNNQLKKLCAEEIRYILIADNPGIKESTKKEYLVGPAGKAARRFFNKELNLSLNKNVIVLNKTPIFTKKTHGLKNIIDKPILKTTQEYMTGILISINELLNDIPIVISGFGNYRVNGEWLTINTKSREAVCKFFYRKLRNDFTNNNSNIYIVKHFSYGHFKKDVELKKSEGFTGFAIIDEISKMYKPGLF